MKIANVFSVMANGTGTATSKSTASAGGWFAELFAGIIKIGEKVLGWIATIFVKLVQFMLRIVDFFQFFVGRLTGIDTWSTKTEAGKVSLADTDVIFRFLLSKPVRTTIYAVLGLSILLLIIFTIIAIVKTDYDAATDVDGKKDGSKLGVMKKAGKSLFLMIIVPIILVFGILGSNAVLASLANAIKGDTAVSLGGQIFSASSYEANRYRQYAESGQRIPVDFGSEVLTRVFEPERGENALGGLVDIDGVEYFVAPKGYDGSNTTAIKCNVYTLSGGNYEYFGTATFARSTKKNSEVKITISPSVGGDNITATGGLTGGKVTIESTDYYVLPELTRNGVQLLYKNDGTYPVTSYALGYMGESNSKIIKAVYRSWKYNELVINNIDVFGNRTYNSQTFESAYDATDIQITTLANTTVNAKSFVNATDYRFDQNLCAIQDEYYVMADFIDWTVEHRFKFYVVNASNKLIKWNDNVATNYLTAVAEGNGATYNDEKGNISGFVVEYFSGVSRYYECLGKDSELDGETFILCTKVGDYYVPITQNNTNFTSSYLADNYGGVIVARGLFDTNDNPTFITKATADDVDEVAYYGFIATTEDSAASTIYWNGTVFVDNIDGSNDGQQPAKGKIVAFNSAGNLMNKELAPDIAFEYVKVDDLYIRDGVQYITLHFYDENENYVFTANVIGTRAKEGDPFTSSLFDSKTTVSVVGVSYPTLHMINASKPDVSNINNSVKYIYYQRQNINSRLVLDVAFGINLKSVFEENGVYGRFELGYLKVAGGEPDTLFNLTTGSAILDYNFNEKVGIAVGNLYDVAKLNYVILLFGAVLIFIVLGQAVWGLIKRIYDVVLLTILYPAVCSTLPLDDGQRFGEWRKKIVAAVLGTYGIVLGINLFFVLLPLVRSATDIFTQEDIPAALQGSALFGNADFLNRIVYLMFVLVLFTFIKTLPSLISGLVGGDDVYKTGGSVKKDVIDNVKAVGDHVSGRSAKEAGKTALSLAGSFVPGSAIVGPAAKKLTDKAKSGMTNLLDAAKDPDKKADRKAERAERRTSRAERRRVHSEEMADARLARRTARAEKREANKGKGPMERFWEARQKHWDNVEKKYDPKTRDAKIEKKSKKAEEKATKLAEKELNPLQKVLSATEWGAKQVEKFRTWRVGRYYKKRNSMLEREDNIFEKRAADKVAKAKNKIDRITKEGGSIDRAHKGHIERIERDKNNIKKIGRMVAKPVVFVSGKVAQGVLWSAGKIKQVASKLNEKVVQPVADKVVKPVVKKVKELEAQAKKNIENSKKDTKRAVEEALQQQRAKTVGRTSTTRREETDEE